jgi:hypothetical protein
MLFIDLSISNNFSNDKIVQRFYNGSTFLEAQKEKLTTGCSGIERCKLGNLFHNTYVFFLIPAAPNAAVST